MTSATILVFPRPDRSKSPVQERTDKPCQIIPFTGVYRMRIPDEDFLIATSAPAKRSLSPKKRVRRSST